MAQRYERALDSPGDHDVESTIVCVITRFHLAHARDLLGQYRAFRAVAADAENLPGLLRSAFLVENSKTFYNLSIWSDRNAIPHFGTEVERHVTTARQIFGKLGQYADDGSRDIWSTKWKLMSVSNNLNWDDFDLRKLLEDDDRQSVAPPESGRWNVSN